MRLASSLLVLFLVVAWLSSSGCAAEVWRKTNPAATLAELVDVAYGNGLYVAVGGSELTIITSTDLKTWLVAELPYEVRGTQGAWTVAYGPEAGFVVVAATSPTLVSKDGTTTQRPHVSAVAWRAEFCLQLQPCV
jgi:hypothetical protein